jgi:hypothetical protein
MTRDEFPRRYLRLSDSLYKFIAALASREHPDWGEREDIEMAIRFIRRLEDVHDKEQRMEKIEQEFKRNMRRQDRLQKKRANVVKLVTDGKDAS